MLVMFAFGREIHVPTITTPHLKKQSILFYSKNEVARHLEKASFRISYTTHLFISLGVS